MDAPKHFVRDGKDIASIGLEQFVAPAVLIDVRDKMAADYFVSKADVEQFEQQYGAISPKALIFALTGWGQYWSDPKQYRNENATGQRCFPGFGLDAIEYLPLSAMEGQNLSRARRSLQFFPIGIPSHAC